MIINKFNATFKVATLSLVIAISSCGGEETSSSAEGDSVETKETEIQKQAPSADMGSAYNMFSREENKLCIFSIRFKDIIEKLNLGSLELPPEVGMFYPMIESYTSSEYLGLDIDDAAYGIALVDDSGEPSTMALTMKVTSIKQLESLLNLTGMNSNVKAIDINGESFSSFSERGMIALWDDKDFLIVTSAGGTDVKAYAKELLSFRNVIADENEEVVSYFNRKDDMNALYLMKDLAKSMEASGEIKNLSAEYLAVMQEGSSVMSANFKTGEMLVKADIKANAYKNSEFNIFNADPIDKSFYNYLTNDKVVGAGMLSINMETFSGLLESFGMGNRESVEFKEEMGMELSEFLKLGTGQFSLAINGVHEVNVHGYSEQVPSVVWTAGIKDSTALGNLIRSKGVVTSQNGYYTNKGHGHIVLKEDKLIFFSDETSARFFGSGSTYPSYDIPSSLSSNKNGFGFMNTDRDKLPSSFLQLTEADPVGVKIIEYIEKLESVDANFTLDQMVLSVKTKDKSKNILEYFASMVLEVVNQEMQSMEAPTEVEEWDDSEFETEG